MLQRNALSKSGIEGWKQVTGREWDGRLNHYMENALSEIESCLRTGIMDESEAKIAAFQMGKRLAYELQQRGN